MTAVYVICIDLRLRQLFDDFGTMLDGVELTIYTKLIAAQIVAEHADASRAEHADASRAEHAGASRAEKVSK